MPSIDEQRRIGIGTVAPLRAIGHNGPVEDHAGLCRPALAAERVGNNILEPLDGVQELERMLHRQIVICTGAQALDITDDEVRLKGMACTAARDGAQRGICPAAHGANALRGPEQERKLQQAELPLRINSGAAPPRQQVIQAAALRQRGKIARQHRPFAAHRGLAQRRLRQLFLLIGDKFRGIVVAIAHEEASSLFGAFVHSQSLLRFPPATMSSRRRNCIMVTLSAAT